MRKYEVHPREYNIISISRVFQKLVSDEFKARGLFDSTFEELISVIKNGVYYHAEIEGNRDDMAKSFLKKVNAGALNLQKIYRDYDRGISEYEKFRETPTHKFSLDTLKTLYDYYDEFIDVAFTAVDSANFLEIVAPSKRSSLLRWLEKTRKRGEDIYKSGETEFAPRYLKWLSKKLRTLDPEHLKYVFFTEFIDFADKGKQLPSKRVLESRRKLFYIMQSYPNRYYMKTGKDALAEINKKKLFDTEDVDTDSLNGQIAYPGKVKGKVCLIFTTKDMSKFKKGQILVSPMTMPNYLPIMKKAGAFVTDEGGTLCHAAIVARELKTPCVIGTKVATQLFKDGDIVEVDANEGAVRRVN